MPNGGNEAFACVLVDEALWVSGWDLLNPKGVCIEIDELGSVWNSKGELIEPPQQELF